MRLLLQSLTFYMAAQPQIGVGNPTRILMMGAVVHWTTNITNFHQCLDGKCHCCNRRNNFLRYHLLKRALDFFGGFIVCLFLLSFVAHGLPTAVASPAVEHRLRMRRLSGHGSGAQPLRGMWDLPGPGHEPVSPASAGGLSQPLRHQGSRLTYSFT